MARFSSRPHGQIQSCHTSDDTAATHIEAALRALASGLQAAPIRAYLLKQFAFLGIRATPRREALRDLPKLSGWGAPEQIGSRA